MRRVVITGIGLVTPLGGNAKTSWDNLLEGKSGIKQIDSFDVSDLPAKIAGLVPHGDQAQGLFDPDQWMEPKEQRKVMVWRLRAKPLKILVGNLKMTNLVIVQAL
jgi:3-oxoacyl-[acyl-carrier-protein] synthase II